MADSEKYFYEVALPIPVPQLYTYYSKSPDIEPGARVQIRARARIVSAFVVNKLEKKPEVGPKVKIQPIDRILDEKSLITDTTLSFAKFFSDYYGYAIGMTLKLFSPPGQVIRPESFLKIKEELLPLYPKEIQAAFKESSKLLRKDLEKKCKASVIRNLLERELLIEEIDENKIKFPFEIKQFISRGKNDLEELDKEFDGRKLELIKKALNDLDSAKTKAAFLSNKTLKENFKLLADLNFIDISDEDLSLDGKVLSGGEEKARKLSEKQAEVFDKINSSEKPSLLHGVTGSGKTEIFLQLTEKTMKAGKQVLYLLPEIALTPQIAGRFIARFGKSVCLWHSGMTSRQKNIVWNKILSDQCKILVGTRSSLFCPFSKIGLIVVDEEHDQSYKQNSNPRYQARDMAMVLAKKHGAKVVLGSATPSLESVQNSISGKYDLAELRERIFGLPFPEIEILDLSKSESFTGPSFLPESRKMLIDTLEKGDRVIIYQNRRGYSVQIQAVDTGEVIYCPDCSVPLTFYKKKNLGLCHACGSEFPRAEIENVFGENLRFFGSGTEKLEEEIQSILPAHLADTPILRLDRSEISSNLRLGQTLEDFRSKKPAILIGTRMVTKGHDFPDVQLVILPFSDIGLHIPDYRSFENLFQDVSQISGRAGRSKKGAKVILQTLQPGHEVFKLIKESDFDKFFKIELERRERFLYPPFIRLVQIMIDSDDERLASNWASQIKLSAQSLAPEIISLGPAPMLFERIKGRFRFQVLAKSKKIAPIFKLRQLVSSLNPGNRVNIIFDLDPGVNL